MTQYSNYRVEVKRRNRTDVGYEHDPWVATATHVPTDLLISVQFGAQAELAFAKVLPFIDDDRQQREPVTMYV